MVTLNGNKLTLEEIYRVAIKKELVALSSQAIKQIEKSYRRLMDIVEREIPVYGLNTGYGIFADQVISNRDSKTLNRNLIISHAVGTGLPLPIHIVKSAMLIRANTLAKGFSGVKFSVVKTLVEMLNKNVSPVVYSKGSLGSSGDLCMLAQMALVMSRGSEDDSTESGLAQFERKTITGTEAMKLAGLERLELSYKDGLALINGATFSTAVLALCVHEANRLCDLADLTAALSLEALTGKTDAFDPGLHRARGLTGQMASARKIQKYIKGSSLIDSHEHIQDAYSLRCAPQVHGAARDTVDFVKTIAEIEVNAATDNPLILDDQRVISGGNFHGEPIGMAADFLGIALSELAAISERRIFRLMDKNLNFGLPAMLVDSDGKAGLNSGVMLLQYTAAALVLESQTLSSPDSVRSLPTSANQEDHNANAFNAALHLLQILENTAKVIAIEYYCACRAIDLRKKAIPKSKLGEGTIKAYDLLRSQIKFHGDDSLWGNELEKLYDLILHDQGFRDTLDEVLV